MSAICASPIAWESLVAYWADDLAPDEIDRIDEHVMGCDVCFEESRRVAGIARSVSQLHPPFLSAAHVEVLRARGLRIIENLVPLGTRKPAVFPLGADILLLRLGGLDLARVESAQVTVLDEETGVVSLVQDRVPFDRSTGEILVACQRHFGENPRTVVFEVTTREPSGVAQVVRYAIPHVFEERKSGA